MNRLVVISNRVAKPDGNKGSEGGLAVGVNAAMAESGGLWFGWNGKVVGNTAPAGLEIDQRGNLEYATLSLTKQEYNHYYQGFANSVLWPLFHQRPELMKYQYADFQGYRAVNDKFAAHLAPLLRDGDIVWVHDYHLIPLAKSLQKLGVKCPIGFFLHTPFPPLDLLRTVPEHKEILRELMCFDLVGFQTETDLRGFRESMHFSLKADIGPGNLIRLGDRTNASGVYPIGIETDRIPEMLAKGKATRDFARLRDSLGPRKLIIGVDRLDYSKGLEHRFAAYERLLQQRPEFHRNMVYLQITPLSRGDVQAYGDFAHKINETAGHIIGSYADFDWMPLRYLTRGFRRNTILAMYNLARVGFVTPLRDGMNLVAKEYVVAQDPEDPGVLVLSKMAGAAAELDSAVIVNPYDIDAVGKKLALALTMPADERKDRWSKMMVVLKRNNIHAWHRQFIGDLKRFTGRDEEDNSHFQAGLSAQSRF